MCGMVCAISESGSLCICTVIHQQIKLWPPNLPPWAYHKLPSFEGRKIKGQDHSSEKC